MTNPSPADPNGFIGLAKVKARYDISDATVDRRVKRGDLPAPVYFGRFRYWRLADLDRLDAAKAAAPAPAPIGAAAAARHRAGATAGA
ncbi:helix-turn-helix transcriptional regulator [Salinarimonas chemoclinalis]|uniref:helix-turn-helix transcriptional regulator n=1 Tax=Salinarimonas chemoclinalis TaxID=3241599 RepID=UPI003557B5DE